jgi:PAS domain S-box-containing protein
MMLDHELFDLFERTADAVFVLTEDGEICSWNRSAEALFGFPRDEAIGKTCFELFAGRDTLGMLVCTEHCHVRDCAARRAAVPDFDLQVKTRAGTRVWVNMSTIVDEDSRSGRRRIVHLVRSVAERKRAEALMHRVLRTSKRLVEISNAAMRPPPVTQLSASERRVLRGFSEGRNPSEIVRELKISPQTLRNHLHHINRKLGTHSRLEAVMHAIRRQLI